MLGVVEGQDRCYWIRKCDHPLLPPPPTHKLSLTASQKAAPIGPTQEGCAKAFQGRVPSSVKSYDINMSLKMYVAVACHGRPNTLSRSKKIVVCASVVEPELELSFLAGAGAVKKGAAPAPALQLNFQL